MGKKPEKLMHTSSTVTFSLPVWKERPARWPALPGSEFSVRLLQQVWAQQRLLVLIAPDASTLQRLSDELTFFSDGQIPLLHFPDWETLPYDRFSPHQDIISQRLRTLATLPTAPHGILLVPATTLMQRLPPPDYIAGHVFYLKTGDQVPLQHLPQRFSQSGYHAVAQVLAPGEFAVRGALVDVYPMGAPLPYRIDLEDEEIASIRTFDPETQRTVAKVPAIDLLPAREFPLTESAIQQFRQQFREQFPGNPGNCIIYTSISQGSPVAGSEYYLPLFFTQTATLFDYLPGNAVIVRVNDVTTPAEAFWHEIQERYEQLRHDRTYPLLPPEKLYLDANALFLHCKRFTQIVIHNPPWQSPDIAIEYKAPTPLHKFQQFLQNTTQRILICAESAGRREVLQQLLQQAQITPQAVPGWSAFSQGSQSLALTVAPLMQGLTLPEANGIVLPESALLGEQVLQRRRRKSQSGEAENFIRNLAELHLGDAVVHVEHGIGRYRGLQTLAIDTQMAEYLVLEYAENAKIYVPVAALHLIHRYSGSDAEHVPLNKLGTGQWEKAKRKAAEQIRDVAAELLIIHAQRAARPGTAYTLATDTYTAFCAGFPFEETPDQQQAIQATVEDLCHPRRMDRLICGDVGFGKTEVAMRAAFVVVQAGYQVAVLVPTTLLAQQHYQNFCDRFADWPVRIALLSRFRTRKEQQTTLQHIQHGQTDIVIGTHKLLQAGIQFHRLGLVIIDEEHRFGVQQKEQFKKLRAEVDMLALTATPIPRTLNMSFAQLRDLSIIGTPPARRLAIKTFVQPYQTGLIREAVWRELLRGGQVFYLHNDVATIHQTAEKLQKLVPEARIGVAHGQMRERELEKIMREFYHQQFNVLICTTIIETGIDIPSANTIIIERADKFGLAQLHQLRGRVGRSHHQAYAYLFTPAEAKITPDAEKRLAAIARLEDLGAGFALAMHDLEIRGAGEILGEQQSGHMQAIGFSLYMELLNRAVKTLQSGEKVDLLTLPAATEIDIQIPALFPDTYLPDVHARLIAYKRLANAKTTDELAELQVEFIDRFGLLPPAAQHLFILTRLKLTAQTLGVKKITGNSKSILLEFTAQPNIDMSKMLQLLQQQPQQYKLEQGHRLRVVQPSAEAKTRLAMVENVLHQLYPVTSPVKPEKK